MKSKVNLNPFIYFDIAEGTKSYFDHIEYWPNLSRAEKDYYKKAHVVFKRVERSIYQQKNMQIRKMTDTIKLAYARRFDEDAHERAQDLMAEFKSLDTAGDIELNRILREHRENDE